MHEAAKLGRPMVSVLLDDKAYAIEQLAAEVPGILKGWYLGQETGNAIADILFGDVNPSGHFLSPLRETSPSATVSLDVGPDQLAIVDAKMQKIVAPGPV